MKKAKMLVTSAVAALTIGAASIAAFADSTGKVTVNKVTVEGAITKSGDNKRATATTMAGSAMDSITSTAILRYMDGSTARSVSSTNTETITTYCSTTALTLFGKGYSATGIHEAEHNGDNKIFATFLNF